MAVTIYGRILAETDDAWLFAPATRLEPDAPTLPARRIAKRPGLQAINNHRYSLDAIRSGPPPPIPVARRMSPRRAA